MGEAPYMQVPNGEEYVPSVPRPFEKKGIHEVSLWMQEEAHALWKKAGTPRARHLAQVLTVVSALAVPANASNVEGKASALLESEPIELAREDTAQDVFDAYTENVILSNDLEKIADMLEKLPVLAVQYHLSSEAQATTAGILFDALSPEKIISLAHRLPLLGDSEHANTVIYEALEFCADDPTQFSALAQEYDKYHSHLTDEQKATFVRMLVRRPALFASTFKDVVAKNSFFKTHRPNPPLLIPVPLEEVQGNISAMREVFGTERALALLEGQVQKETKGEFLYALRDEILANFTAHEIEGLLLFARNTEIKNDPITALYLLQHVKNAQGHTKSSQYGKIYDIVTDALKDAPVPQTILRDAEELQHALSLDRVVIPSVYDSIIFANMRSCIKSGEYRALSEYLPVYAPHVQNIQELETLYGEGALRAFQEGDYTTFQVLYKNITTPRIQEKYFGEYTTTLGVLSDINAHQDDVPFAEVSVTMLQNPVTPDTFPMSDASMEQHLVLLGEISIAKNVINNEFHGTPYYEYGRSFISIPQKEFRTILYSGAFKGIVGEYIRKDVQYTYANVFSLVHTVYRRIQQKGEEISEQSVHEATEEILTYQQEHADVEIVGPNTQLILATHEEPQFDPGIFLQTVYFPAGGTHENIRYVGKGLHGDLTLAKDFLQAVQNARDTTVIVLDGHGFTKGWSFQGEKGIISYQAFGDALITSGNIASTRIIIPACYGYDFLENLFSYLASKGVQEQPRISMSGANKGRVGWTYPPSPSAQNVGAFFWRVFADAIQDPNHVSKNGLKFQDIIHAEGVMTLLQDLAVFVPEKVPHAKVKKAEAPKPAGTVELGLHTIFPSTQEVLENGSSCTV